MTLHATKTLSLDRSTWYEGLEFSIVKHHHQLRSEGCLQADAILIDCQSTVEYDAILQTLRQSDRPEMYLKPVFVKPFPGMGAVFLADTDGKASPGDLASAAEKTRQIQHWMTQLSSEGFFQEQDQEFIHKTLQWLFTRQTDLRPTTNRHSKIHYSFPFARHFFQESEEHKLLGILSKGEKQGYLTGLTLDKVHLCGGCGSSHQNLRATCPKCKSVDINQQDLVHHFPCAHIAPISDFRVEGHDGLHCPKCDKGLRHIGNDYDKPAQIYNCNNCNHNFQQAQYRSLCIDCHSDVELHHLREADICQYTLTAKGKAVVQNGQRHYAPAKETRPDSPHSLDFEAFKKQVQKAHNLSLGVAGMLKIEGFDWQKLSAHSRSTLKNELCEVIKSYLKPADSVSVNGESFYFLMEECRMKDAEKLKETLEFNLKSLIEANLKQRPVTIKIGLKPLGGQIPVSN
jgi:hypothetical protein